VGLHDHFGGRGHASGGFPEAVIQQSVALHGHEKLHTCLLFANDHVLNHGLQVFDGQEVVDGGSEISFHHQSPFTTNSSNFGQNLINYQ